MTVSQVLNHVNENSYDDDITVTDVPNGHFLAIIANSIAQGSTTREMTVDIMPLEQSGGGTMTVNSSLYIRQADETAVQVKVTQNGTELANNTTNY